MTTREGRERRMPWSAISLALVSCVVAIVFDRLAYEYFVRLDVYDHDWGRLLRVVGYWPTWGAAATSLWLNDRFFEVTPRRRALLIGGAPAFAGIVAEALKLVLRRERPDVRHGEYVFRAFSDRPFSSAGIGSPSSHAAVAFAAAAMLAYLFPRTRVVWFSLAIGCAATRVLAHAHYLSDVAVGAIVGLAATEVIHRHWAPGRRPLDTEPLPSGTPQPRIS